MTIQYSTLCRNERLNAIETVIGTAPILYLYDLSGTPPVNCASDITATTLATFNLPSDWMDSASGGSALSGTAWTDSSADAAGTADFFRIYDNGDGTCHVQGSVGAGGALRLNNYVFAVGQSVSIDTFQLIGGNEGWVRLPQNLITGDGTLSEGFENVADWTVTGGTAMANTSQVWDGSQSIELLTDISSAASMTKTISEVMSGNMRLAVFLHDSPTNKTGYIAVSSIANFSNSYKYNFTLYRPNAWHVFNIKVADWIPTGSPSWANTQIRLKCGINTAATGEQIGMSFDSIYSDVTSQAAVMFAFSDANVGVHTYAYPHAKLHRYRINWLVRTGIVGYDSTKVSWEQLQEMQSMGCAEIGHHTKNHTDLTSLSTQAEMETEIQAAYDDLDANGLSTYKNYFCPVGGGYNAITRLAIIAKATKLALTGEYVGSSEFSILPCDLYTNPRFIFLRDTLTLASAKTRMDTANSRGELICFLGDNLADAPSSGIVWSKDDWDDLVEYAISLGLPIITASDVYTLANSSIGHISENA